MAFANNAIDSYAEYWNHIESAFKTYGFWDELLKKDSKGTSNKKLEALNHNPPEYKRNYDYLLSFLYPEAVEDPNQSFF